MTKVVIILLLTQMNLNYKVIDRSIKKYHYSIPIFISEHHLQLQNLLSKKIILNLHHQLISLNGVVLFLVVVLPFDVSDDIFLPKQQRTVSHRLEVEFVQALLLEKAHFDVGNRFQLCLQLSLEGGQCRRGEGQGLDADAGHASTSEWSVLVEEEVEGIVDAAVEDELIGVVWAWTEFLLKYLE